MTSFLLNWGSCRCILTQTILMCERQKQYFGVGMGTHCIFVVQLVVCDWTTNQTAWVSWSWTKAFISVCGSFKVLNPLLSPPPPAKAGGAEVGRWSGDGRWSALGKAAFYCPTTFYREQKAWPFKSLILWTTPPPPKAAGSRNQWLFKWLWPI